MKLVRLIPALFLATLIFSSKPSSAYSDEVYTLSSGDIITVTVFNEPELGLKKVRVSEDGTISMPLLGQVNLQGKTISQVEQELTKLLLADYLKKPDVTVIIDEFRPFYINGEVKKPGSYPYRTGLTVEMAITLAGGFTERASKSKISLTRKNTMQPISVQLTGDVKPGDVITIKESFF